MGTEPNIRQIEGGIVSLVEGDGITVDVTDPANPVIAVSGAISGQVDSVVSGTNVTVDDSDPENPVVNLDAALDAIDSIQLNTSAGVVVAEGQMAWNATDFTLDIGLPGDSVLQVGQELPFPMRNETGSTITNGQAVFVSGAQGDRAVISLAQANMVTSTLTIGVATQDIPDNDVGLVTTYGYVRGIDTSAWSEGDELWLSATVAGGLTNVRPTAPDHIVHMGVVIRVHATVGFIFINPISRSGIAVTDGTTAVDPVLLLDFDNTNMVVTDDGGGQASIDLSNTQEFSTFSLNTTDDTGSANAITAASSGVLRWDNDGVNTSVALQVNGVDSLVADQTGISGASGTDVTLGVEASSNTIGSRNTAGTTNNRVGVITGTGAATVTTEIGRFVVTGVASGTAETYVGGDTGSGTGGTSNVYIGRPDAGGDSNIAFFDAAAAAQQHIDSSDTDANRIAALEAALLNYGLVVDDAP